MSESSSPEKPRSPCRRRAPLLHRLVDEELAETVETPLRRHVERCAACHSYLDLLVAEEDALGALRTAPEEDLDELWVDLMEQKVRREVAGELEEARTAYVSSDDSRRPAARALLRRRRAQARRWSRYGAVGSGPPDTRLMEARAGTLERRD